MRRPCADQVMMHGRGRQQRRDRNAVRPRHAVGQDDDVDALADGGFGAAAQFVQHLLHARGAEAGVEGGVERARVEMRGRDFGDRADLLQVRVGQDRLAHLEPLGVGEALDVEQVRPRADDRHEAHDEFLADRIDRRVRHLREVLLEVGEQQLRLVRQRRDRRVGAHRAGAFFAGRGHRRHQDVDVFLGVAERLLAIEQRQVRQRALVGGLRQLLQHELGAVEPLAVGMAPGERRP